jgi:hypothetical protein
MANMNVSPYAKYAEILWGHPHYINNLSSRDTLAVFLVVHTSTEKIGGIVHTPNRRILLAMSYVRIYKL